MKKKSLLELFVFVLILAAQNIYAQESSYLDINSYDFSKPSGAYISGSVGTMSYNDIRNIDSQYVLGGSIGQTISPELGVEFDFQYSYHIINESYWRRSKKMYTEVDQFNFSGIVKYSPVSFRDKIRPYVGGIASYNRRVYSDLDVNFRRSNFSNNNRSRSRSRRRNNRSEFDFVDDKVITNSVDLGGALGVDILLSSSVVFGFEFRYMKNFINRDNSEYLYDYISSDEAPLESVSYSVVGGKIKFAF